MDIFEVARNMYPDVWERSDRREEIGTRHDLELATAPEGHPYQPWTDAYLDIVEGTLGELPPEHVAPLERLQLGGLESRASGSASTIVGEYRPGLPGVVKVDGEPGRQKPGTRNHGCVSQLAGHVAPPSTLAETVAHEIGHLVHNEVAPEIAAQIVGAAGWHLQGSQWQEMVRSSDDFVPMTPSRCGPDGAPMSMDEPYSSWDSWDYARSGHGDYFAEMYSKSVNYPETLYEDLVGRPDMEVEQARESGNVDRIHRMETIARQKKLQWDLMRQEVFGVDAAMVQDRVADLEALGDWTDADSMEAAVRSFERDAERAMTPAQLDRLLDRYLTSADPLDHWLHEG